MIALRQNRPSRRFILTKVAECLYRSEAGSYFGVVKHLGKQHRLSLQTKDRDVARKKLSEFRQQLCVQTAPDHAAGKAADPAAITFGQLAKRWLDSMQVHLKRSTHSRRRGAVKVGLGSFRKKAASKISKLNCEQWATSRSKQVKGRTFNYEVETLNLIFKYAISHGLLSENPAAGIRHRRLDTAAVLVPTRAQFRMLVADMRQRTAAAGNWIEFLGYSGCRTGEAAEIRWKDVDWSRKTLMVDGGQKGTKNHESRTIPLFPPLERLLRDMQAAVRRESRPEDKVLPRINARWALATACRRLGLPSFHRHSLRHFFASNCVEVGVDFRCIAGWLGHKDGGALLARTYSHLRAEHSVEMARRITFDAGASAAGAVTKK
jgi:integrase